MINLDKKPLIGFFPGFFDIGETYPLIKIAQCYQKEGGKIVIFSHGGDKKGIIILSHYRSGSTQYRRIMYKCLVKFNLLDMNITDVGEVNFTPNIPKLKTMNLFLYTVAITLLFITDDCAGTPIENGELDFVYKLQHNILVIS